MNDNDPSESMERANFLVDQGWRTNLAAGSVTRARDQKSGLVDDDVWQAMNFLLAEKGWVRTEPQPMSPSESWGTD